MRLKLPRHFDVPGPSLAGSMWWGRGLHSLPIPPVNPTWHQPNPAVPRWEWVLQQRAYGKKASKAAAVPCSLVCAQCKMKGSFLLASHLLGDARNKGRR